MQKTCINRILKKRIKCKKGNLFLMFYTLCKLPMVENSMINYQQQARNS